MNEGLKKAVEGSLLFLLDGSGSMFSNKFQTLDALNQYINTMKNLPLQFKLVVWDSERYDVIYSGHIEDCPRITDKDYKCAGGTPLLDTIGKALVSASEGNNKKFITVLTDGYENASREFTYAKIKHLVSEFREKGNEVAFLGAEIDAFSVGLQLNINPIYTQSYNVEDSQATYRTLANQTTNYFSSTKEE